MFATCEPLYLGKALSTPHNFAEGTIDSIRSGRSTRPTGIRSLTSLGMTPSSRPASLAAAVGRGEKALTWMRSNQPPTI